MAADRDVRLVLSWTTQPCSGCGDEIHYSCRAVTVYVGRNPQTIWHPDCWFRSRSKLR